MRRARSVPVALHQRLHDVEHARRPREQQRALPLRRRRVGGVERAKVPQQRAHELELDRPGQVLLGVGGAAARRRRGARQVEHAVGVDRERAEVDVVGGGAGRCLGGLALERLGGPLGQIEAVAQLHAVVKQRRRVTHFLEQRDGRQRNARLVAERIVAADDGAVQLFLPHSQRHPHDKVVLAALQRLVGGRLGGGGCCLRQRRRRRGARGGVNERLLAPQKVRRNHLAQLERDFGADAFRGVGGVLHVAGDDRILERALERLVVGAQQRRLARPVEEHPELLERVDDRRAGHENAVRRLELAARHRDLLGRVLDRVALVEHDVVPLHRRQLLGARADHAVRRQADAAVALQAGEVALPLALARAVEQHDGRLRTPDGQLALPVVEQRRRQHDERAIDHAGVERGAQERADLHRLAHAHVVAQNAAVLLQVQLPQPRDSGALVCIQFLKQSAVKHQRVERNLPCTRNVSLIQSVSKKFKNFLTVFLVFRESARDAGERFEEGGAVCALLCVEGRALGNLLRQLVLRKELFGFFVQFVSLKGRR
jgi:hypothetical protein